MEEAYATASLAIGRLASVAGDEARYLESGTLLQAVLHRRPVVLGFVVTTFAKRLQEGSGGQPVAKGKPKPSKVNVPHKGIRLALEAVLECYRPSMPHSVAAVVGALGEDRLEALLLAAEEGATPLLTWNARLCLLHAYLAHGSSGGGRGQTWLPAVADSACSSALQAIATAGGDTNNNNNNNNSTVGRGKRRAQPPTTTLAAEAADKSEPSDGGGRAGSFSAAAVAQVCAELAGVGAGARATSLPARGSFLDGYPRTDSHGYPHTESHGALHGSSPACAAACAAGLLPGEMNVGGAFRLKLQALRDALLAGAESKRQAAEQIGPKVAPAVDVVAAEVDVSPQAVQRALERSRVGEDFVLAVQAALESAASPAGAAPEPQKRKSLSGGETTSVPLKECLQTCLLGDGLPEGQGLLFTDITPTTFDTAEGGFHTIRLTGALQAAIPLAPLRGHDACSETEAHPGCALLQGLAEEGVRVQDLLLTLLDLHQGMGSLVGRQSPEAEPAAGEWIAAEPPASSWLGRKPAASSWAGVDPAGRSFRRGEPGRAWTGREPARAWAGEEPAGRTRTGAEVVATVRSTRDARRRAVGKVIGAFLKWLADNPWIWGAAEGQGLEAWEGDITAAAMAVALIATAPLADERSVREEPSAVGFLTETGGRCGDVATWAGYGGSRLAAGVCADPTDLLDRIVAGAAAATADADADRLEWLHVLSRVTSATGPASLGAYAAACVEKSVALGGQAPFRVAEKRRFSLAGGKALWGLLEGAWGARGNSLAEGGEPLVGGGTPARAVLVRAAVAAVTACRKLSRSWMISPGLLSSGPMRIMIDMLEAAQGSVAATDLLGGLLVKPGEEGPALAADLFAAFVAGDSAAVSEGVSDDGSGLRSQVVAWLGDALSAARPPSHPPATPPMDSATTSTNLARLLTRRVPYESKAVLLAVGEATDIAISRRGAAPGRSKKRRGVSGTGDHLASLAKLSRTAGESPLLPLGVPLVCPVPCSEGGEGVGLGGSDEVLGVETPGGGDKGLGRGGGRVPLLHRLSCSEGGGGGGGEMLGVDAVVVAGGGEKGLGRAGGRADDEQAAAVTAGLVLDAFEQSPPAVMRAIRGATQQRDCNQELLAVHRALRMALCTPPPPGALGNPSLSDGGSGGAKALLAGLGGRRAAACLLVGHLVESGVPGWEETKAAMVPPPGSLVEAAEAPFPPESGGAYGLQEGSGHRLTALRLEMWLRPFLCDDAADSGGRFGAGFEPNLIPDVFRTARTIARAITRHASAFVADDQSGDARAHNNYRRFFPDNDSGGVQPFSPYGANGSGSGGANGNGSGSGGANSNGSGSGGGEPFRLYGANGSGSGGREPFQRYGTNGNGSVGGEPFQIFGANGSGSGGGEPFQLYGANGNGDGREGRGGETEQAMIGQLESPRQALIGRLHGVSEPEALVSWVSSLVKTMRQYRQWIPWQPFADELRGLVLEGIRQPGGRGGGGEEGEGGAAAAAAGVFASCELLLAWEGGQEISATVFRATLCSSALNAAVAPVPGNADPPVWLEVLRHLLDSGRCDLSSWTPSHPESSSSGPQDPFSMAAAAAVWIGGDGPEGGHSSDRSERDAWVRWYGATLGPLVTTRDYAGPGKWLVLSSVEGDGGVLVHGGIGWAAHTVKPENWEDWGRSPLQAAWNFPAGRGTGARSGGSSDAGEEGPPPSIVLPPFAAWLRVVLRGAPNCAEGLLEGYLRRMAREVYLPCEFVGASGEMARQWLGALIEAEAGADGRAKNGAVSATAAACKGVVADKHASPNFVAAPAAARRLAVQAFFREELLRFGSGEAPAAPVGGPLTWLWPLEAVVTACGRSGVLGSGMLARRQSSGGRGSRGPPDESSARVVLDAPPSALARALCAVPHDLLCGSRRFGRGGGRPPPATLRAFATRAVDLAARALATPPCRHWSVARRLLLGLGLLYHALARPEAAASNGNLPRTPGSRTGATETTEGNAREHADGEAAAAQTAALATIEALIKAALGGDCRTDGGLDRSRSDAGRCCPGSNAGSGAVLPSACRLLRPLETTGCAGSNDLAEALRGAGAWRAATAFFGWGPVGAGVSLVSPSVPSSESSSVPPVVGRPRVHVRSSPVRAAAVELVGPKNTSEESVARCVTDGAEKEHGHTRGRGRGGGGPGGRGRGGGGEGGEGGSAGRGEGEGGEGGGRNTTNTQGAPKLAWRCPGVQQRNFSLQKRASLSEKKTGSTKRSRLGRDGK